jgi:hypothetical protein
VRPAATTVLPTSVFAPKIRPLRCLRDRRRAELKQPEGGREAMEASSSCVIGNSKCVSPRRGSAWQQWYFRGESVLLSVQFSHTSSVAPNSYPIERRGNDPSSHHKRSTMLRYSPILLQFIACHAFIKSDNRECYVSRVRCGLSPLLALKEATFGMGCFWYVVQRYESMTKM